MSVNNSFFSRTPDQRPSVDLPVLPEEGSQKPGPSVRRGRAVRQSYLVTLLARGATWPGTNHAQRPGVLQVQRRPGETGSMLPAVS